jgi:hypothetical protein
VRVASNSSRRRSSRKSGNNACERRQLQHRPRQIQTRWVARGTIAVPTRSVELAATIRAREFAYLDLLLQYEIGGDIQCARAFTNGTGRDQSRAS